MPRRPRRGPYCSRLPLGSSGQMTQAPASGDSPSMRPSRWAPRACRRKQLSPRARRALRLRACRPRCHASWGCTKPWGGPHGPDLAGAAALAASPATFRGAWRPRWVGSGGPAPLFDASGQTPVGGLAVAAHIAGSPPFARPGHLVGAAGPPVRGLPGGRGYLLGASHPEVRRIPFRDPSFRCYPTPWDPDPRGSLEWLVHVDGRSGNHGMQGETSKQETKQTVFNILLLGNWTRKQKLPNCLSVVYRKCLAAGSLCRAATRTAPARGRARNDQPPKHNNNENMSSHV